MKPGSATSGAEGLQDAPRRAGAPATPLRGRRVLVTRSEEQAGDLVERLRMLGAEPVLCPTIQIVPPDDLRPLDAAIDDLDAYGWLIFTSVNGVRFFLERLEARGRSIERFAHAQVAAIGPVTAEALGKRGVRVDFVPTRYVAETLVEQIGDIASRRVLLPQADLARDVLADGLRSRGARVDAVTVYRTVPAAGTDLWSMVSGTATIDIATFTSPSTIQNFMALLGAELARKLLQAAIVACIGPITARAAEESGVRVDIVAAERTVAGLVEAIIDHIELHEQER